MLAAAVVVTGHVVAATSHWTDDGASIVTDAVIEAADGSQVTVSQLGGVAGGFGQVTFPGPAILATGQAVTVDAHLAPTLAGTRVLVVDDVHVTPEAGVDPYVREGPTPAGSYLSWGSGCVFMTYDDAGTSEIPGDGEFAVLDAALATWNTGVAGCGYIQLKSDGRAAGHEVGKDYINLVKFRDTRWCHPASGGQPEYCLPDSAAALTTVTFIKDPGKPDDGQIVDTDVEINGVNFAISTGGVSTTSGCKADLANTVTHELGHVLGLEHTCVGPNDPARVDGNGQPVPSCTGVTDPKILDATMYPYQACGETIKATLSADDIAGACAIYPTAKDPKACAPYTAPGGCCDAGGGGGAGATALAGAVLAVFARPRRRRPRARAPRDRA